METRYIIIKSNSNKIYCKVDQLTWNRTGWYHTPEEAKDAAIETIFMESGQIIEYVV